MASQKFQPMHFSDLKGKTDEKSPLLGAFLLFFVFFFTLLFLFLLYICTHRSDTITGRLPTNQNGALRWSRLAMGLDAATIGGLPTFSYESSVSSNKINQEAECCVCLSIFEEGDKVKVLPRCRHGFHSECVDKWLRARSSCPLCRASVLQDSNGLVGSAGNSMATEV